MAKLMPLPAMMLPRNAVDVLRYPMARRANPKVHPTPTTSVAQRMATERSRPKYRTITSRTSDTQIDVDQKMSAFSAAYSRMLVTRSPVRVTRIEAS